MDLTIYSIPEYIDNSMINNHFKPHQSIHQIQFNKKGRTKRPLGNNSIHQLFDTIIFCWVKRHSISKDK